MTDRRTKVDQQLDTGRCLKHTFNPTQTLDSGVPCTVNYVDPVDFGKGPFRWVLFDKLGGNIIGTSDPFNLPTSDPDDSPIPFSYITLP